MQPKELNRIRRRLGLTQAALAAQVGVTGNTVARWERGEVPIGPVAARLLHELDHLHSSRLVAQANFRIDPPLLAGLQRVKERDGMVISEQIRRAIDLWLAEQGVNVKTKRTRAATRSRS